jgi:putative ABC transport system permease protein
VAQRPGRSVLTSAGTVIGVAVLISVSGFTATAQSQIGQRFDALTSTELSVVQLPAEDGLADVAFPADAEARVLRVNGVQAAGVSWAVSDGPGSTLSTMGPWTVGGSSVQATVVAASPGFVVESRPTLQAGRLFDAFYEARRARVAIVGAALARELRLADLAAKPALFVDGVAFTVVGVLGDVGRHADSLTQVLIPTTTALSIWGAPDPSNTVEMYVQVKPGAAAVVGQQVAVALRPDASERFRVIVPPDPRTLRDQVTGDLNLLFLLLAGASLLVGAVGIANITFVAVLERVSEIGTRRALGARPKDIATQFLLESTILGACGGLLGASLGLAVVVAVAAARSWTAVLPTWTLLVGPTVGGLSGLLAGWYPSMRAARIEPAEALRR